MYTLLSGLYKYMFQKDEYCILILGLDNAGKTVCARPSVTTPSVVLVVVYLELRVYCPESSAAALEAKTLFCSALFSRKRPKKGCLGNRLERIPVLTCCLSVCLSRQTFLEQSKTRFNKNYKGMSLSKITTTVGLNIGTVDVGKARLMFWDLGGQEELQSLWDKAPRKGLPVGGWPWGGQVPVAQHPLSAPPQYYAECHGVIYVIDSTDEERLSESKRAFEKMVTSEALDGVPILVLANKQDVETCLSIPDIKTAFSDCTSKIGRRDCLTQACSALTGKGVREGIEWMVKCVVRNVHRPPRQRDIT
uniref:ARF related protein 1 n=1 Tax=Felis catus TaxID=9685 RepID=A0ABI7WU42_FELCA